MSLFHESDEELESDERTHDYTRATRNWRATKELTTHDHTRATAHEFSDVEWLSQRPRKIPTHSLSAVERDGRSTRLVRGPEGLLSPPPLLRRSSLSRLHHDNIGLLPCITGALHIDVFSSTRGYHTTYTSIHCIFTAASSSSTAPLCT